MKRRSWDNSNFFIRTKLKNWWNYNFLEPSWDPWKWNPIARFLFKRKASHRLPLLLRCPLHSSMQLSRAIQLIDHDYSRLYGHERVGIELKKTVIEKYHQKRERRKKSKSKSKGLTCKELSACRASFQRTRQNFGIS